MIMQCIYRLLCKLGHHDFVQTALWRSKDNAVVITEDICSHCGEDAYSLTAFLPNACTSLKRQAINNSTCEDQSCDGSVCEKTGNKKSTAQRKPRNTVATEECKAAA